MTTGNPSCQWVRDWLPLLAGDGELISDESGDLGAEDRCRMERHLSECSSCRQHRVSLEGALSILGAMTAESPSGSKAGSLWPDLDARIRRHHEAKRPTWVGAFRDACPEEIRTAADRFYRGWEEVHAQLPIRMAWAFDSARECLDARLWVQRAARDFSRGLSPSFALPRLAIGLGLAALVLALVLPAVHRHRARAESTIALNAAPIPGAIIPPAEPRDDTAVADHASESDTARGDSLAQADPPPPADVPTAGQGQGAAARTPVTTPTASRYDLEYGIPATPDTRVKPAY